MPTGPCILTDTFNHQLLNEPLDICGALFDDLCGYCITPTPAMWGGFAGELAQDRLARLYGLHGAWVRMVADEGWRAAEKLSRRYDSAERWAKAVCHILPVQLKLALASREGELVPLDASLPVVQAFHQFVAVQELFRPVVDFVRAGWEKKASGTAQVAATSLAVDPKLDINDRMLLLLSKDSERRYWTLKQWSEVLGCSRGTVAETKIWKESQKNLAAERADSQNRARRRSA
jgi:hypothetical protein